MFEEPCIKIQCIIFNNVDFYTLKATKDSVLLKEVDLKMLQATYPIRKMTEVFVRLIYVNKVLKLTPVITQDNEKVFFVLVK